MKVKSSRYWTHFDNAQVDTGLSANDGWKLAIRWLVDEHHLGSRYGAVAYSVIPPGGGAHELHAHDHAEEVAIYVRGRGLRTVADEQFEVGPGDIAFTPAGVPHAIHNLSEAESLELYCIYLGASSVEKTGYRHIKR